MENRFIKIFSGLERNYGYCNVKNGYTDPETGKLKFKPGDYGWSQDAVTDQDYIDHINGENLSAFNLVMMRVWHSLVR